MIRPRYLGVVMFAKVWPVAAVVTALVSASASAQTVSSVGGPRELPPAGYTQQQYVDSRGCVFLRAGLGGTVRWVPRVGRDKKAMCGATPTFAAARAAVAELNSGAERTTTVAAATPRAMPEPAPSARVPVAAPAPIVAPARVAVAAAPLTVMPTRTAQPAAIPSRVTVPAAPARASIPTLPVANGNSGRVGCFESAPVLQRVALSNGGSALVCTRGDGTLTGWRSPVFAANAPVGAALTPPPGQTRSAPSQGATTYAAAPVSHGNSAVAAASVPIPTGTRVATGFPVPAGYVASWKDDRLNPMRGIGTAAGQAQQDQVWTRKVPAKAVKTAAPNRVVYVAAQPAPMVANVTVSAMNAPTETLPTAATPARTSYIQVGAFGDPANAQRAIAQLSAAGLPVSSQSARGLKVVLAGPFASAAQAQGALGIARGAGFSDAFVR